MGLSGLPPSVKIIPSELASALSAVDTSQKEGEQKMYLTLSGGSLAPLSDQAIEALKKSGTSVKKLSTPEIVEIAQTALKSLGSDPEKTVTAFRIAEHTYGIAQRDKVKADKVVSRQDFFKTINTPKLIQNFVAQATKMRGKPLTTKECRALETFLKENLQLFKENPQQGLKILNDILKFYEDLSPGKLKGYLTSLGVSVKEFGNEEQRARLQDGYELQRKGAGREPGIRDIIRSGNEDVQFKKDCVGRVEPFVIRVKGKPDIYFSSTFLKRMNPKEREEFIIKQLTENLGEADAKLWIPPIKILMTQIAKASSLGSPTAGAMVVHQDKDKEGNPASVGLTRADVVFSPTVFVFHKAKNEQGEERMTSVDYVSKWSATPEFNQKSLKEKAVEGELSFTLTMPDEGATLDKFQNLLKE